MIKPIKHFLTALIPQQHLWKIELFKKWDSIVGNHLKDKISIKKIENGILYLSASHPVWAQELLLLSPLLKEQINAQLSEKKIRDIKFCAAPQIAATQHNALKKTQNTCITHISQKLNSQEYALLASLPSPELQSAIAAYFIRCKTIQRRENESA
ncbi:MAG: DUF721 domain-containing protein [Candidatus Babeliales bacterium]|jgi:hypothetical protein